MVAKLRCLFAALFCLVPALAWGQAFPGPGQLVSPLASDMIPLYRGEGGQGILFGQANQLAATLLSTPNVWTAPQTWGALQTFVAGASIGSVAGAGTLTFPFVGTSIVSLPGGNLGGGVPRLFFGFATLPTNHQNAMINFGSLATWPQTAYGLSYQGNILNCIDPNGVGCLFTAMRTSDWTAGSYNAINTTRLTAHDGNSYTGGNVWGTYDAAERVAGLTGAAAAQEFFQREYSFHNLGPSVVSDPFTVNPAGGNFILRLDSGVGTGTGNNVTSGLDILNNGGKFNTGINFGATAIDTVSGHIRAISLATTQEINWFSGASTLVGALQVDGSNVMQLTALQGVNVSIGPIRTATGTAPSTGTEGINMSSTANLGIFFSNGTPTVAASDGSLDLDTTGKLWVRASGSWTQVTVP